MLLRFKFVFSISRRLSKSPRHAKYCIASSTVALLFRLVGGLIIRALPMLARIPMKKDVWHVSKASRSHHKKAFVVLYHFDQFELSVTCDLKIAIQTFK